MVILVCFDLPRNTKTEKRQATRYQKRLVELGFDMKQFSIYEREVRSHSNKEKLINTLKQELPDSGAITIYQLPNHVSDNQLTILGENSILKTIRKSQIIYL